MLEEQQGEEAGKQGKGERRWAQEGKGMEGAMKEGSLNDSPDFDQRWVFV